MTDHDRVIVALATVPEKELKLIQLARYPNADLIQHGRVEDLLSMEMKSDGFY